MSAPDADPFGRPRRGPSAWRSALVYFGLTQKPDADVPASSPSVPERLAVIEARLDQQQRTLDEILDRLR